MSHVHRFHVPELDFGAGEAILDGEEAHHALKVVRLRVGEPVALFDGRGGESRGRVAGLGKRHVTIEVIESRRLEAARRQVTLLQAWLKRDKPIEEVIRHGTALGVSHFAFFRADRSERAPSPDEKWRRIAVETCKQSGRLWVPDFTVKMDLGEVLQSPCESLLIAAMEGQSVPLTDAVGQGHVAILIGPEGDFSAEELALADSHGARAISLGTTTLRSELAAVVACTLVQYELGALGPGKSNHQG